MGCENSEKTDNVCDEVPKEKDYGWGVRHIQLACMCLGLVVLFLARSCMAIAVLAMTDLNKANRTEIDIFDWDKKTQGLILSSFFWGYLLMQIPGSIITKRFGGWIVILVGTLCNAVICLTIPLLAHWGGWPLVCFARVLMGLTQSFLFPTTHTLLGRWFPSNERTTYSGIVYGGAQIGTIISMPLSGLLSETYLGWKMIFFFCSATLFIFAIIWYFFAASCPEHHRMMSDEERYYIERYLTSSENIKALRTPWRIILTSRKFWAIAVAHWGLGIVYMFFFVDLPSYLEKGLNISLKTSASISALPYLGMLIGGMVSTKVSDDFINKNIMSRLTVRKLFNSIAAFGAAAALIALTFVTIDHKTLAVAILVISLTVFGSCGAGYQVNHLDLSPNYAGVMYALTNTGSIIGCISTPLVISFILRNDPTDLSRWHVVFAVMAGVTIVTNIFYLMYARAEIQPWNDPDFKKKKSIYDLEEMKPVLKTEDGKIVLK